MNRFFRFKIFSRAITYIKPNYNFRYLTGLTLGIFAYAHHRFQEDINPRMEPHSLSNELIGLSKSDYFNKILENPNSFFFLVIYKDSEENSRTATRIGKHLKRIADSNQFQGWNIYTINRSLFDTLKNNAGPESDLNILSEEGNPFPLEIYLKTPFHSDFLYLPFRPNKFFEARSTKKMLLKMKKVENLLEVVHDEEDFNSKLIHSLNKINTPTVVMHLDDSDNEKYKEIFKQYSKFLRLSLIKIKNLLNPLSHISEKS